jgi:hypothetical protein
VPYRGITRRGYTDGPGIRVTASRLLTQANVVAALQAEQARRRARHAVTKERVIAELALVAFEPVPNLGELFDAQGDLKRISALTLEQQRYLLATETVTKNLDGGDGHVDEVRKVKVRDNRSVKVKALELLADILGLRDGEALEAPDCPAFALPPGTTGVNVH